MAHVNMHAVRCAICKSPDRNDFDEMYLSGASAVRCAQTLKYETHTAERHVTATKLRQQRLDNTLSSCQSLIEHCQNLRDLNQLPVNGNTEVQALRLQAELKKEIEKSDTTLVLLQQLPAEAKGRIDSLLIEYNRVSGVIKGADD